MVGGGSFPIRKISLRFFRKFWGGKNNEFSEKGGGHANPNEFRCKFLGVPKKAQHCFPKIWWGGGQRPFGSFPKIHPNPSKRLSLSGPCLSALKDVCGNI